MKLAPKWDHKINIMYPFNYRVSQWLILVLLIIPLHLCRMFDPSKLWEFQIKSRERERVENRVDGQGMHV